MARVRPRADAWQLPECASPGLRHVAPDPRLCAPRIPPAVGLRSHEGQRLLSELARLPRVHLAASMDHVNAALLWDQQVGAALSCTACSAAGRGH